MPSEDLSSGRQPRTPAPSDLEHAKILIGRTFRKDRKKPLLWFARFVGMGLLLMLYTIGFFLAYDSSDSSSTLEGDYRLYKGRDWSYPAKMRLAGFDNDYVTQVGNSIESSNNTIELEYSLFNDTTAFATNCTASIASSASQEVCVYLNATDSYVIYFGGKESATPFQDSLAASQWAVNSAMLNVSGAPELYPVSTLQRVPRLLADEKVEANVATLFVPAIMHVLSAIIMTQFLIGPLTYEKLNDVTRSFLLVGVKFRTYLLQWVAYFSLNGIITAIILTMISIFYRIFPQSDFGLVFMSHYFGLVQLYSMFVVFMQFFEQEELAQGMPWLFGLASICIGAVLLIFQSPDSPLFTLCTLLSPFVGMMQYYGIYITYDSTGYDTGIHAGDNVVESGLLANLMAQLGGIVLWMVALFLYSSPKAALWWTSHFKKDSHLTEDEANAAPDDENEQQFEPLAPGSDVLVSVRGLEHTYYSSGLCKKAEPVEVLKGLDVDICRGEVFGYLGEEVCQAFGALMRMAVEIDWTLTHFLFHSHQGTMALGSPHPSTFWLGN